MPIPVECPECGARNRFPDHLAGKSGRCKSCGERIPVRRSKKKSKKKSHSGGLGLVVGAVVGGVVVIVGLIAFLMMSGGHEDGIANNEGNASSSTDEASLDPIAGQTADSGDTNPPMDSAPPPIAQTGTKDVSPSTESGFTPSEPNSSKSSPSSGFQPPAASGAGLTFAKSGNWAVAPDSAARPESIDVSRFRPIKVGKDMLRGSGVVFPPAASSFVAVRTGPSNKARYSISDLTTGKEVGNAPSQGYSSIVSLAPNGSYLAGTLAGNKQIEVYDLKADKSLGILQTDSSGDFQISQLAVWADRLVAVSNIHNGIKVWDLPSGQLKHDIKAGDKFNPDYGHAFSPSGKYLAVDGEFLKKQIDFYDLADGKVVGSISPEGETRVGEIEAMGFSQEGDKFAAIYGVDIFSAPARKYSRVVVWDLKTGKLSSDFELEPKLKDQLDPVYQNHFMESLPGTNRWLVQSQGIVDADEQQLVLAFPKQQGVDLNPSRKVMEPNTVAAVITEKGDPRIELETFSQEDLLAGAASAAAGGMASDAGLPPLTPSDFTEAREALASNEWAAPVDGLRTTPIRDSIRVASDGTARDIAISRSESPVIVIRVGIGENSNDPAVQAYQKTLELLGGSPLETKAKQPFAKESELSAFDASGKELGKVTIPYSAQLWSVSPNGQLAVLEQHETNGRLDIYQLQESGEHIVGWRPYRAESEERHREIKRVEFIDNQTVATLSMNYQLVVWNVPQAKPLWRLNEVRDFELTPGGKALIAVRGNILGGKSLAVFESRTGEGWGGVELDGATKSLAFHPNGQLLAISRDSGADKLLRIVDFETGETVEEFPIPAIATSISWTGDEFLLLNTSQLVNRKLQAVVWSYSSGPVQFPLAQVNTQPTFLQLAGNRAVVRTVDVPSETVAGRLDPAQLRDQAILKPGDPVKLRTSIASEPKLLSLRNVAEELVSRQLEAAGSKVGDSDIELAVTGSIVSEGNATVSKIGDRSVSETVMRKTIVLDFTYSKGGKPLWTSTRRVGNLDQFLVRLQQGQTAQEGIDQQMAERAQGVLRSMKLPSFIFGEQAARGLGTSSLVE